MKKTSLNTTMLAALLFAGGAATANAQDDIRVEINGQPLRLAVAPMEMNGRTLVPMRAIFNALGANVNYDRATRAIRAIRGNTNVNLQIGSRAATINGQNVMLDQVPLVTSNRTMVPLRFVAEALGAQVNWNDSQRLVSIQNDGNWAQTPTRPNSGSQVGGYTTISVPRGSVVKVSMDEELSSATSRVGDAFTASVVSEIDGDSEFPRGTRIEGVVTQASRRTAQNPGVLELDFRTVILPNGERRPLRASLIALDNDSVDTSNRGRIVAREASGSSGDRNKAVIIGAGAGFVVGKLLKKNSIITSVLGAAGGYLYDRRRDRNRTREAVLARGQEIGVRVDNNVTYSDVNYSRTRRDYMGV